MGKLIRVIKQSTKFLIVIAILWVILAIIFVSPIAYSIVEATTETGRVNSSDFLQTVVDSIISFNTFGKMFNEQYFSTFVKCLGYYTIGFVVFSIIGFMKSKPKGEYHDMEHGSSDWSEHGEQYKVLSKNKGIILAEDNYLPVDKRGNINTLIVGRIRFW